MPDSSQRVFGEVLAQHLVINDNVYRDPDWRYAAHHVMSPRFGPPSIGTLWQGLQAGMLQTRQRTIAVFALSKKRWAKMILERFPMTSGVGPDVGPLAPWRENG